MEMIGFDIMTNLMNRTFDSCPTMRRKCFYLQTSSP